MFKIMLQKLVSKKWMNLCLLLGSVLLIATVVSFPLYQAAAYDRMLQDVFRNYQAQEGDWPAYFEMNAASQKDKGGKTITKMENILGKISGDLGVTPKMQVYYYSLTQTMMASTMNRSDVGNISVRLSCMSDLDQHAKMLSGDMYSESGLNEEGEIEVVVSQAGLVNLKVLVGESFEFTDLKNAEGKKIRLKVVGVFDKADAGDVYWRVDPDQMDLILLMQPELFREMFTGDNAGKYTMNCSYFPIFEYEDITAAKMNGILEKVKYTVEEGPYKSTIRQPAFLDLMENYAKKQGRIQATLVILQIPVLIMLGAFLFMISGQMYDMERNEISVIKSRGSSRAQIFRLYLYQSFFLTCVGGVLGVPLGTLFSRILGSSRNFLEFEATSNLQIVYTREALYYTLGAMLATLLIMTLPAIRHSKISIVNLKQQKALKKKSWWEKIFLDIILLGVSGYGYYSFSKNTDNLAANVLKGEPLDPLLYISSSLFIMGLGLLFLRLQPYLIQLVYLCGKKFWKPASYASFMENQKNGRKQQFIMLFLIMTISLGMYHATVARTILQNAVDNVEYLDGADVILKEVWSDNSSASSESGDSAFRYFEPDVTKYNTMDFAQGYAKVIYDTNAYIAKSGNSRQTITLMGIHTKEFGTNTSMPAGLNEKSYHEYLNELAVEEKGILVSENFKTKLGYKIGDTVEYKDNKDNKASGVIVDFVSYWPGYSPTHTVINPDGEPETTDEYLLIAHYNALRQTWGVTPYEIWISMKDGYSAQDVYQWVEENNLHLTKYVNKATDMEDTMSDPLLQGTNGVLTMGFIVTLLLCAVGYLIYWVMSIKSREMIFGVLRACGMHKGELFHMLMNEQLFSGILSILAGIGIGKLTSWLFVPMLQMAYAAANQVIPMRLITNPSDMIRLYIVIAGVVVVCLAVLIILIFKMNVAKALKLGEE